MHWSVVSLLGRGDSLASTRTRQLVCGRSDCWPCVHGGLTILRIQYVLQDHCLFSSHRWLNRFAPCIYAMRLRTFALHASCFQVRDVNACQPDPSNNIVRATGPLRFLFPRLHTFASKLQYCMVCDYLPPSQPARSKVTKM